MFYAQQIWEETTKKLQKVYDRREAENITYQLLADLFGILKTDILLNEQKKLDQDLLKSSVTKLLNSQPVQYVTGSTYFYGRQFQLEPGVLIPRPETEELVDLIIKGVSKEEPRILEVGVGSGCIAVTLSLEVGGKIYGTDVSDQALQMAEVNNHHHSGSVTLLAHDILKEELPVSELDFLVSNPPYIPISEKKKMHANVLNFEPEIALFVPDEDPLLFYRRIAIEGRRVLNDHGKLYFEIHENLGDEVTRLLSESGYTSVMVIQDMQGKDRMVVATNSTSK